jgi:predicted ATPase/DNA-binding SARP family transcriptional activator
VNLASNTREFQPRSVHVNASLLPRLNFHLLGPPQVSREGMTIPKLTSAKAQALLYYLAMTGRLQPRSVLASLLWSEQGETEARGNLRKAIQPLREHLADYLVLEGELMGFSSSQRYWVDAVEFATQLSAANTAGPAQLQAALALYHGDFLEGFYVREAAEFEAWMLTQRARLRELLLQGHAALAEQHASQGDLPQAIAAARRLLELEPWREEVHRQLMIWLAHSGQRSAALAQYELCRRALIEELDVEPAPATIELYERLCAAERELCAEPNSDRPLPTAPPLPLPHRSPNLPAVTTPLVGREQELAALQQRLDEPYCRLLTLVGPGGIGKTRLALEVASRRRHLYADGVCFVNLQPVRSTGSSLPIAIADALHIALSSGADPWQQVQGYLANKQFLLVLDNFEQLVEEATALAELLAAPRVQLLVTSREVLNLQEEWLFWVEGIAHPAGAQLRTADEGLGYEAVQLFGACAQRIQPTFALAANVTDVVRICQWTEGMPLAIELAAAWTKTLSCAEIAEELKRGLEILSSKLRNVPSHHRSMQAVFDHSWHHLREQEREVFAQLAVFRGGFTREAAEQVAGASRATLASLVDQSLLRVEPSGRYQIHELLRQYALEKAASAEILVAARQRHSGYFAEFLARRADRLWNGDQVVTLAECTAEFDNIRAMWRWAVEHFQLQAIQATAHALYWIAQLQSRYLEIATAFESALERLAQEATSDAIDVVCRDVLVYYGWLALRLGRLQVAEQAAQQSLSIYQRLPSPMIPGQANHPLLVLAYVAASQGDHERAEQLAQQVYHLVSAEQRPELRGPAAHLLAVVAVTRGHYEQAQRYAEEAFSVIGSYNHRWFLSYTRNELGIIARLQGNNSLARKHFEESYTLSEEFNSAEGMGLALHYLGEIALSEQDDGEAQRLYEQSVALYREINDRGGLATAIKGLGDVALRQGQHRQAEQHYQQALQIALDIQYLPLVFSLFLSIGNLFLQTGRQVTGLNLLALVLHHPASDYTHQEQARQLRARQLEQLEPGTKASVLSAPPPQWNAVLREVQAQFLA